MGNLSRTGKSEDKRKFFFAVAEDTVIHQFCIDGSMIRFTEQPQIEYWLDTRKRHSYVYIYIIFGLELALEEDYSTNCINVLVSFRSSKRIGLMSSAYLVILEP